MDFEIDKKGRLLSYKGEAEVVRVPDGVTEICQEAFFNVYSMKELVIPEGVTKLEKEAASFNLSLKKLTLPDSLETIAPAAFQTNFNLEEVHLGSRVKEIQYGAFYRCVSLRKINFPPTLKILGPLAFSACDFEEVILPEGLTNIGINCFFECEKLKKVYIPSTAVVVGSGVFTNCGVDLQFEVAEGNPEMKAEGCNLLTKDGKGVLTSSQSAGTWHVPEVSIIAPAAMKDSEISGVVMPWKVWGIGADAFRDCKELTDVQLPLLLSRIGAHAFAGCEKLRHITLPHFVERIDEEVFADTGITSLELPESVEHVGWDILEGCRVHQLIIRGKAWAPMYDVCSEYDLDKDAELIADALSFEEYPEPFEPIHSLRGYARRVLRGESVDPAAAGRFQGYLREEQETLQSKPLFRRLMTALNMLPQDGDETA